MKFSQKILRIGGAGKMSFFLVGHFDFVLFCFFSYEKKIGFHEVSFFQNFDDYPGFQPKTTFLYYFADDCR